MASPGPTGFALQIDVGNLIKVTALQAAVAVVDAEAQQSLRSKRSGVKFANAAKEFSAAVATSCAASGTSDLPWNAVAPIQVAIELMQEATEFMQRQRGKNVVSAMFERRVHGNVLDACSDGLGVLSQNLQVRDGRCHAVEDASQLPFVVTAEESTNANSARVSDMRVFWDGIKVALVTIANATDGFKLPLKAVSQTVSQLIKHFEMAHGAKGKAKGLVREMQLLLEVLLEVYKNDGDISPTISSHIELFFCAVHRVAVRIGVIRATGNFKQLVSTSTIDDLLSLEAAKLKSARRRLKLFLSAQAVATADIIAKTTTSIASTTSFIANTTASIADRTETLTLTSESILTAAQRNGAGIEIALAMVGQVLTKIDEQSGPAPRISISATPPRKPRVFHGRDDLVEAFVTLVTASSPARIVILGPGGIGKTSIALSVLHEGQVADMFGDRRYFVPCDASADANDVVANLASILQLPKSADVTTVVHSLKTAAPTFLVLDNYETVWMKKDPVARKEAEQLLQTLEDIETVTLVITSRGSVAPPDVRWSNLGSACVDTLSSDEARLAFLDRAPVSDGPELAALDELLMEVDYMPLAVKLLAFLAVQGSPPTALLRRWYILRCKMIKTQANGREDNMEVCIQLAIDLMLETTTTPEALALLSICSLLPDGMRTATLEQLRPEFEDIEDAMSVLQRHALVYLGPAGEWRMLSPVRHYVNDHYSMSLSHTAALQRIYFEIAAYANVDMDEQFPAVVEKVTAEYGNLHSVLLDAITRTTPPSDKLVSAVCDISLYTFRYLPSTILLRALVPRLSGLPTQLGKAQYCCGQLHRRKSEFDQATQCFIEARTAYDTLGDTSSVAMCIFQLANVLQVRNSHFDALRHFGEAEPQFRAAGMNANLADCIGLAADSLRRQCQYDDSTRRFREAEAICEEIGDQNGVAWCTAGLGHVSRDKCEYNAALDHYNRAIQLFQSLGHRRDAAELMRFAATVHRRQSRYDESTRMFREAEDICVETGDRNGVAWCAVGMGEVSCDKHEYTAALEHYDRAIELFAAHPRYTALCVRHVGTVLRLQRQFTDAFDRFQTVLDLSSSFGDPYLAAGAICGLGDICSDRGDFDEARRHYSTALEKYKAIGKLDDIAICTRRIGVVYFREGKLDDAIGTFRQAAAMYADIGHIPTARECAAAAEHLDGTPTDQIVLVLLEETVHVIITE